ncbi:MAG: anaerobic sulfatase maturase [Caldilineales bacterium]|nr:anaerobic sulfatase maturase [Caldilineales bacterium]
MAVTFPPTAPPAFHLLAKPTGAICNLDCSYCFFLSKEMLYPGSRFRMADELLETYVRQLIESHRTQEVQVAWQGGEPTLMGLDFFKRSVELAEKYRKPGMRLAYSMQTNGTRIDDEWAKFFKQHNFLIGISFDGPRQIHDHFRVDKGGKGSFDQVMRGWDHLRKHRVDFNILCTVHAGNVDHPLDVYHFFRDELKAEFIQFIPIVERINDDGLTLTQSGNTVTDRSVSSDGYGRFLIAIFDEWVRRDVGKVYVQLFDVSLGNWYGEPPGLCVFSPTCGNALAIEHNGDLYSCDHFVEPDYLLGNIQQTHMIELVASPQQRKFGQDKLDSLPNYCRQCEVRFACHGGCPKNRFIETPDGEPGLNYLCASYKAFFNHIDRPMRIMSDLLRQQRAPAEIMNILAAEDRSKQQAAFAKVQRNDPCPCGSGRKYKHCHGAASN